MRSQDQGACPDAGSKMREGQVEDREEEVVVSAGSPTKVDFGEDCR